MLATIVRRNTVPLLVLAVAVTLLAAVPAPGIAEDEMPSAGLQAATLQAADEPEARDLAAACPSGRPPGSDFTDIGPPFDRDIECLLWYGVTQGLTATTFGTGEDVTRRQMVVFLYRLLQYNLNEDALPGEDVTHDFADVATTDDQELGRALNALSSDELADFLDLDAPLARGFGDGTYRPHGGVERAQMASFLARTINALLTVYNGVASGGFCTFVDTAQIPPAHREPVSDVCALGVAQGRDDGTFSPRTDVTRGQMAAFLMRTQDIFADEPFYGLLPDQDVEVVDRDACDPADADGTGSSPWCTIQEGVDAAVGPTTRVLIVGSETSYTEHVDLTGGRELFGVPVPHHESSLLPSVDGSISGDTGGEDVLVGRLGVTGPAAGPAVDLRAADEVRLVSLLLLTNGDGVRVQGGNARIDAVTMRGTPGIGLDLDVSSGVVLGSDLYGIGGAHVVDRQDTLDLGHIMAVSGPGQSNIFRPAGSIVNDFEGSYDAIVPTLTPAVSGGVGP